MLMVIDCSADGTVTDMLLRSRQAVFAALLAAMLALATSVSAQPIGIFSWQLQPYCNVVTLNVTQTGSVYTLDGYDDQCGAATRASAAGLALLNPDGTIGMGVAIVVSPGGAPVHVSAAITLPSVSGTWRDSSGNTGTLAFSPGPAAGSPRPPPTPVFVGGLSAGGGTITNVAQPVNATDAATKGYADSLVAGSALPPASRFIFQTDGGFAALGTFGSGTIAASGGGTRLLWHPAKAALRAGRVTFNFFGSAWDHGSIGIDSVAFGFDTRASGPRSSAMGFQTTASGDGSMAIGVDTTASGFASTAMGYLTTAVGDYSIAMGNQTTASGLASTAMGVNTTASGDYSTALGYWASTAGRRGAFVYGDWSTATLINATADNQFTVRAMGGVRFFTNSTLTSGVQLAPGASAWTTLSDINSKHLFHDLDGDAVLAKLAAIPIREWSYKAQDAAIRHVGPTAQDFRAAFGLGEDPLGISTIDADGIALRAIQALEARTRREREALAIENAALRAELAALRKAITALLGVEP
jgi:Chaperone of endosialidase/YadA head domain repeat (2 copies)